MKRKTKRIHVIGNSKEPTIGQMLKMVENLRNTYNVYSSIDAVATCYNAGSSEAKYRIYIEDNCNKYPETWPEAIKAYRKLMKGKKDGS